jgi:hypothetical protein
MHGCGDFENIICDYNEKKLIVSGELGFGCPHCLRVFTVGSVSSLAL